VPNDCLAQNDGHCVVKQWMVQDGTHRWHVQTAVVLVVRMGPLLHVHDPFNQPHNSHGFSTWCDKSGDAGVISTAMWVLFTLLVQSLLCIALVVDVPLSQSTFAGGALDSREESW